MEKETHHHYTNQERFEYCRKCRISGKTVSEFARDNGIKRGTLKDWMHAYNIYKCKFSNKK